MISFSESRKDAESAALSFDSHDSALDFAEHCVERARRWLVANTINVADHYLRSELEVVAQARSLRHPGDYHLVFRVVPRGRPIANADFWAPGEIHSPSRHEDSGGQENFVFVGITKLVHGPEQVIPSLVWLERRHEVKHGLGNVPGSPFAYVPRRDLCVGIPEGKMSAVAPFVVGSGGDGESGLVKRGAHTTNRVERRAAEGGWNGFSELDLMKLLSGVGVWLKDQCVWVAADETKDFPLEFAHASLRMFKAGP